MPEGLPPIYQKIETMVTQSGGDYMKEIATLSDNEWFQVKAAAIQLELIRHSPSKDRDFWKIIKNGAQDIKLDDEDTLAGYHSWRFFTKNRLNESEKNELSKTPVSFKILRALAGRSLVKAGKILEEFDKNHGGEIAKEFTVLKELPPKT